MALVTKGPGFDTEWHDQTNACLLLLREAADRVARHGAEALQAQLIVDAIYSVLATPLPPIPFQPGKLRYPSRFFAPDATARRSALESCRTLRNGEPRIADIEAISGVGHIVQASTKQWAEGNPEAPETREVLAAVLRLLWSTGLTRRPPGREYPLGL